MADWSERVWLNGREVSGAEASVSVFDRSFLLGDGLFETIRAVRGRLLHLEEHLARLRQGMQLFHLPTVWDDQKLCLAVHRVLDANALEAGGADADGNFAEIRVAANRLLHDVRNTVHSDGGGDAWSSAFVASSQIAY